MNYTPVEEINNLNCNGYVFTYLFNAMYAYEKFVASFEKDTDFKYDEIFSPCMYIKDRYNDKFVDIIIPFSKRVIGKKRELINKWFGEFCGERNGFEFCGQRNGETLSKYKASRFAYENRKKRKLEQCSADSTQTDVDTKTVLPESSVPRKRARKVDILKKLFEMQNEDYDYGKVSDDSIPASRYWKNQGRYREVYRKLYKKLVPSSGNALNSGGELLRCVSMINKRMYNDGDLPNDIYDMFSYLYRFTEVDRQFVHSWLQRQSDFKHLGLWIDEFIDATVQLVDSRQ